MVRSISQTICAVLGLGASYFLFGLNEFVGADNIVETAIAANFTTLVAALQAANLVDTLSAPDANYTVFAPTDEAFTNLPNGTVPTLLLEKNLVILQDILLYHVSPEVVYSTDIVDGMSLTMFNGDNITLSVVDNSTVVINEASTVITADIQTDNGVIHVIDNVLIPPIDDEGVF